jgi:hypothetical protein
MKGLYQVFVASATLGSIAFAAPRNAQCDGEVALRYGNAEYITTIECAAGAPAPTPALGSISYHARVNKKATQGEGGWTYEQSQDGKVVAAVLEKLDTAFDKMAKDALASNPAASAIFPTVVVDKTLAYTPTVKVALKTPTVQAHVVQSTFSCEEHLTE